RRPGRVPRAAARDLPAPRRLVPARAPRRAPDRRARRARRSRRVLVGRGVRRPHPGCAPHAAAPGRLLHGAGPRGPVPVLSLHCAQAPARFRAAARAEHGGPGPRPGARRPRRGGGPMTRPVWVILPTYNEAESLEMAVGAVLEALRGAAPDGHRVLIVDDASP